MNIVKLQNDLKDLSDQQLLSTMQSGSSPQYLVLAEMQRRKKMRDEASTPNEPQAQGTVADEIMGGIASIPMGSMDMASGGLVSFAEGGMTGYQKGAAEACWKNPETGETECPSAKPDIRKPTVKKMQEGGVLRLLPADPVADAYTYLQSRGAEVPADMSEQGIIEYANRVRALDENEVKGAGVNVPAEAAPAARPSWPALFRDYGSGGRGEVMPETQLDTAPQMPMDGSEMAPGFSPVAPTQEGLPGLLAPEGPTPERAVPFLGQVMENIVPAAQAAEPFPGVREQAIRTLQKEEGRAPLDLKTEMGDRSDLENIPKELVNYVMENPGDAALTAAGFILMASPAGRVYQVAKGKVADFAKRGWNKVRDVYGEQKVPRGAKVAGELEKGPQPYLTREIAEKMAAKQPGMKVVAAEGGGFEVVPSAMNVAKGIAKSKTGQGIALGTGITALSMAGDDEPKTEDLLRGPQLPPEPESSLPAWARAAGVAPTTPTTEPPKAPPEPPEPPEKELTGREAYFDYLLKRRKGLEGREKDAANQALMAMGLSMMASKNPDFLGALGEGGIKGLEQYGKAQKEREEQILGLLKEEGDIYAAESMYGTRQGQLGVSAFDKAAKILESKYSGLGRAQTRAALKAKYPNATPDQIENALDRQYMLEVEALAARMQGTGMGGMPRPPGYDKSDFVDVGQK
jgi:hypothetical protein